MIATAAGLKRLTGIWLPGNGSRSCRVKRHDRDPFPGNQIPVSRFNPAAVAIMPFYPAANNRDPAVAAWQNNLAYTEHFNKDVFWNWVGKVDHNFTSNDRVFGRWGKNERNEIRNTTAI